MKIILTSTNLDLTPSLKNYIEIKFGSLSRFVKRFDKEGAAEIRIEVSRTTRHHRKGSVFRAEADLRLPGKMLRAEARNRDIRLAINEVKDELQLQIRKYRTKHSAGRY